MRRDVEYLAPEEYAPMLRRMLRGHFDAITCQLDVRGTRAYEVCVLPHWNPSLTLIERYDSLAPALLRHAEVGRRLRGGGWSVIDHIALDGVPAAA
jgi:hypothetical protein